MALLLVLILVVMTTAAGVFASLSTAAEIRSSGFTRQAAQTHYISEAGVTASLDQLKQYCSAYVGLMERTARLGGVPTNGLAENPLRYRFLLTDFVPRSMATPAAPVRLEQTIYAPGPAETGGTMGVQGSLGLGGLRPAFGAEMTVLGRVETPMVGFGVSGGRDISVPMLAIELSSEGRTELVGVTDPRNNAVGNELTRVIALVPCL